MTQLESTPLSLHPRDIDVLARAILQGHGIELFDDPRTATEVAQDLGYLTITHVESDQEAQVTTL
jgi:hypothetical protein